MYHRKCRSTNLSQGIPRDKLPPDSCPSVVLRDELSREIVLGNVPRDHVLGTDVQRRNTLEIIIPTMLVEYEDKSLLTTK